jgi:hypothetical protein
MRGWRVKKKMISLMFAVVFSLTATACIATAYLAVPRVLGAGPDGIDLRPTPGAVAPEAVLPEKVAGYERGECNPVTTFYGLALGPDAVETTYSKHVKRVRVIAVRMESYHAAATAVSELARRLDEAGYLGSRRLLAEEPYKGWQSASGKRNCAFWYAPDWETDRYGFVWQNDNWCFILTTNDPAAKRDVSTSLPY